MSSDTAIVVARFWAKVARGVDDVCWLWQAGVDGAGNGAFSGVGGKQITARRFSFELENGSIPPKLRIESTCKQTLCVNPRHLFLVPFGRTVKGTVTERFWAQADKPTVGCWEWQGACQHSSEVNSVGTPRLLPYGIFSWWDPSTQKYFTMKAHRFAFALIHRSIQEGLFVCHHCDNPRCVRPDHLFLGTAKDNTQDCIGKGRMHFQKVAAAKLKKKK